MNHRKPYTLLSLLAGLTCLLSSEAMTVHNNGSKLTHPRETETHGNDLFPPTTMEVTITQSTEFVDEILVLVRQLIVDKGYTNISLPDQKASFSEYFFGTTFHGKAELYNGSLGGLETIHRTGGVEMKFLPDGNIRLQTDLGLSDLTIRYKMLVKFMGIGPSAVVTGVISVVDFRLALIIDLSTLRGHLESLDIWHVGHISLDVKGMGFLWDFLAETISQQLGNIFKDIIADSVEDDIRDLVNEILADLPFPTRKLNVKY